MPEIPDFEQIVERIALRTGAFQAPIADVFAELVEQLRLVWNARGTADVETIEATIACHRLDWIEQVRRLDR